MIVHAVLVGPKRPRQTLVERDTVTRIFLMLEAALTYVEDDVLSDDTEEVLDPITAEPVEHAWWDNTKGLLVRVVSMDVTLA
jgi:hypothetical protein